MLHSFGKTVAAAGCILFCCASLSAAYPQGHPRILVTESEHDALVRKIREVKWAADIYNRLKKSVEKYVERHKTDPGWIVSRLQMNWVEGKRYTRCETAGNNRIDKRSGNAPYPTIRLSPIRTGTASCPSPEDMTPYSDETIALLRGKEVIKLPFAASGLGPELINNSLQSLAYRAAVVYFVEKDDAYAKFASDILWVLVRGGSFNEPLNPDSDVNAKGDPLAFGFLSYETLGDNRHYSFIPLIYDFVYPYLKRKYFRSDEFVNGIPGQELWAPGHPQGEAWAFDRFRIFFTKMIENKIRRGGGLHQNWNINEHRVAMLYTFAMPDNAEVEDGRGREYYLDYLLNRTTRANGAYRDVIRANLDPLTGLWPESPSGYGQGCIENLIIFGFLYYRHGIDLLNDDSLLKKAVCSFPLIAFPNGRSTAWGDGGYYPVYTLGAELLIAYAREKGDQKLEREFAAMAKFAGKRNFNAPYYLDLFYFVPEYETGDAVILSPRVSYAPVLALLMGRLPADDYRNSLAYSVYGYTKESGHYNRHALAMEIFGKGHILGCDPGAGPDYWSQQHRWYNGNGPAHNTVIPEGREIRGEFPLTIHYADPMPPRPGAAGTAPKSDHCQFSDVSSKAVWQDLELVLRRTNGMVMTSGTDGFYVDIFRVKPVRGEAKYLDYLYHNMGTKLKHDARGRALAFDPESGSGYRFFSNGKGTLTKEAIQGEIPYGKEGVSMRFFLPGNGLEREFHTLEGPPNFRYYDRSFSARPVPTFLVRRRDSDAWAKPFAAVYEPINSKSENRIETVRDLSTGDGLVLLEVTLRDRKRYWIFSSVDPDRLYHTAVGDFRGIYAVGSSDGKRYLGECSILNLNP